jgi:hypothetical protein
LAELRHPECLDRSPNTFLQVTRSQNTENPLPRSGHENHLEIELLDQPTQVDVNEDKSRTRSPMSQQTVLNVLRLQRLAKQRIVLEINHSERDICKPASKHSSCEAPRNSVAILGSWTSQFHMHSAMGVVVTSASATDVIAYAPYSQ